MPARVVSEMTIRMTLPGHGREPGRRRTVVSAFRAWGSAMSTMHAPPVSLPRLASPALAAAAIAVVAAAFLVMVGLAGPVSIPSAPAAPAPAMFTVLAPPPMYTLLPQ